MLQKLVVVGILLCGALALSTRSQLQARAEPANAQSLPNITINAARLQSSVVFRTSQFKPNDCAIVEGCVSGPAKRSLMKFDVQTPNIGTADLYLGSPVNNPAFIF